VQPDVDTAFGIVHALSPSVVRESLQGLHEAGEQVRAVLITSPTYFGEVTDVATLAEVLLATILALAKNPHHHFVSSSYCQPIVYFMGREINEDCVAHVVLLPLAVHHWRTRKHSIFLSREMTFHTALAYPFYVQQLQQSGHDSVE
jgi:arginine/lysine/ornithine decarboxylase